MRAHNYLAGSTARRSRRAGIQGYELRLTTLHPPAPSTGPGEHRTVAVAAGDIEAISQDQCEDECRIGLQITVPLLYATLPPYPFSRGLLRDLSRLPVRGNSDGRAARCESYSATCHGGLRRCRPRVPMPSDLEEHKQRDLSLLRTFSEPFVSLKPGNLNTAIAVGDPRLQLSISLKRVAST